MFQSLDQLRLMQEGSFDGRPSSFMVYTPCRTAVVYALADRDDDLETLGSKP